MKKILSFLLIIVLAMGLMSAGVFAADRTIDSPTADSWTTWFGPTMTDTSNTGGVWLDKTVLDSDQSFKDHGVKCRLGHPISMDDPDDNFLITLSALASNKSIRGYSYLPTDTMLVLDVSGSMEYDDVYAMVNAANDAIKRLLELNNHNRIGVVLYSGNTSFGDSATTTATILLPLDRYTHATNTFLLLTSGGGNNSVKVAPGVKNSNGTVVDEKSKRVAGGTYIQNGLYQAMNQLLSADTVIPNGEAQAGTTRLPIFVLMSDGAPTSGTDSYDAVGKSNMGEGRSTDSNNQISFVTQLTAAYVKARADEHYNGTTPLFYTLGLGDASQGAQAQSVLNPENSTEGIDRYWSSLISSPTGTITIGGSVSVKRSSYLTDVSQQNYVNEYFNAENAAGLKTAFDSIVNEIIIQSKYYPTAIEGDADFDGYISFIDRLGTNMVVKDVKGMILGTTLFDGSTFAECFKEGANGGALGTYDDPTDLGDQFIWAVKERLGIENSDEARALVGLAYQYGQLYYNDHDDFGNRISIYTDINGNYLGFCDKAFNEAVPNTAAYIVDTYGFIDTTIAEEYGLERGNLLYVSVAVRTNLSTGEVSVLWDIPASMVPMLTREFTIKGDSLDDPGEISMETNAATVSPLRLVYEVGLKDDISAINVAEKAAGNKIDTGADAGKYGFYTDSWDASADGILENHHENSNTVAFFHPNEANERYYYHENSTIYVVGSNGEYVEYRGQKPTSGNGKYYRQIKLFDWSAGTDNIILRNVYEEIYPTALGKALQYDGDNTWYIPMGTVRGMAENEYLQIDKAQNETDTFGYALYAASEYEQLSNGDEYYLVDAVLGNNGKYVLAPAQGIKISKAMQEYDPDQNPAFAFTVSGTIADGTYHGIHVDAVGIETETTVDFKNGKSTGIELKRNETFYLIDLPEGDYKVTESAMEGYELVSVNGVENATEANVTVAHYALSSADFVNTIDVTGGFVIRKAVEHPFGADYKIPENIKFKFTVNLGTAHAGHKILVAGKETTIPDNGIIEVEVAANSSLLLSELDANSSVVVTEILEEHSGFSPAEAYGQSYSKTVGITTTENTVVEFKNKYTPASVYPVNVTLNGNKTLTGRPWQAGDQFSFALEYRDNGVWTEVATDDISSGTDSYDLTNALKSFRFDEVGIYYFRVREVQGHIGGVTYDSSVAYFYIDVADKDMDGKYEIDNVVGLTNVAVTKDGENNYRIQSDFTNAYAASGSATVELNIKKAVDSTGLTLNGYTFGLYTESGTLVKSSEATDAAGDTSIKLSYTVEDLGKTYHYVMKEILPENADPSIDYDTTEYPVSIEIVDNLDGTISAIVKDAQGNAYTSATFNNKEVEVLEKTVSKGQTSVDGQYVAVGDVLTYSITFHNVNGNAVDVIIEDTIPSNTTYVEGSATDNGIFENGKLTWELTVPANTTETVSFDVKVGENIGKITNKATAAANGYAFTSKPVENNVYNPISVALDGEKTLTGRDAAMAAGEFKFVVENSDGKKVSEGTNDASGKITFAPISFYAPGEYEFKVRELNSHAPGMIYDGKVYDVKVTVTDKNGTLTADAIVTNGPIKFENRFDLDLPQKDVTVNNISVDGQAVSVGEVLTYTIQYTNSTTTASDITITDSVPAHTEYVENSASATSGATFIKTGDKLEWSFADVQPNASVEASFRVKVTGIGLVENTATAEVHGHTVITNPVSTHVYTPTSIQLQGTKELTGRDMTAGEFEFVVNEGAVQVSDGANDANGKIVFDTITYTAPGTHEYVVSEVDKNGFGVTYDPATYTVTVDVVAKGDVLVANIVDPKPIVFKNTFDIGEPVKTVKNEAGSLVDGAFVSKGDILTYEISYTNVTDQIADVVITDIIPEYTEYVAGSADQNGVYDSGKLTWTFDDVAVGADVKVSFRVKVTGDGSVQNTATVSANNYEVTSNPVISKIYTPISVTLNGKKALIGRDMTAGEFEFVVMEDDTIVSEGTNDADGNIVFDEITYLAPGEHTYVVKEKNNGIIGVTYDLTEYTVQVYVSADEEKNLGVSVMGADAINFENSYNIGAPQKTVFDEGGLSVDGEVVSFGEVLTYHIQYTNTTGSAVDVTITDAIPGLTEYVEGSADQGGVYDETSKAVVWTFANVSVGDTVKVSFKVKVVDIGGVENQAIVSLRKGDAELQTNKVTTTVETILNREDHFAYIIGIPEDYRTGEHSGDDSLWPVKPMANITRAEVATIFFRMLDDEARNLYWSQTSNYSDVKIENWFHNAICTLTNANILKGKPDGTFAPNEPITRAEFAAIAARFYKSECTCGTDHFSDIVDHWARDEINHAACENLVQGFPDSTEFRPDVLISRAEAVTIVNRMLERVPEKDHLLGTDVMRIWPDNMDTDKWYYAEMQEATNSHTYDRITDVSTGNTIEQWTDMLPIRDWEALEKEWSDANSGKNNAGEVVK